ncbi:MAG: peptidylprolyl isomerase [Chloroflexota bacterium]
MVDVVQDGAVVSVSYTLRLENGEIIDYSEADDPLEYLHGAENIIPGLEKQLLGLHVGDEKSIELAPEDGYGVYDPEELEVIERKMLPKDLPPLKLGMVLAISDEEDNLSEAYVREISPNNVTLDFNHPLAGQQLFFQVQVLAIREASEEEIAHGHPHGEGGHDDFDDDDDDFDDFLDDDDDDDFDDFDDEDNDDDPVINNLN